MPPNPDVIHYTSSPNEPSSRPPVLVYLICGNPGVITFYQPFLTHLTSLLSTHHPDRHVTVHATSLSGFEFSPSPPRHPDTPGPPYTLPQQIRHVAGHISSAIDALPRTDSTWGPTGVDAEVILLGHSVGSYILFEILRHLHERDARVVPEALQRAGVKAGICLFPTIADLAKSPRGRWLSGIVNFPGIWIPLVLLARLLTGWGWGSGLLVWMLTNLFRQKESKARGMVGWFASAWGVRETIVMARDEFTQMLDDKWSDELWQMSGPTVQSEKGKGTKLFFFWGKDDYWVDSVNTRDRIIRARGESSGVVMEVDKHGIDHAFCLEDEGNRIVAEKVAGYIETVI